MGSNAVPAVDATAPGFDVERACSVIAAAPAAISTVSKSPLCRGCRERIPAVGAADVTGGWAAEGVAASGGLVKRT